MYRKIQLQTYLYNYTRKYIEFFSTILRVILIYYLNNIIIITLLNHLLININFKLHIYVSLSESLHSYPLSSFHVQLNARIEIYFLHLIVWSNILDKTRNIITSLQTESINWKFFIWPGFEKVTHNFPSNLIRNSIDIRVLSSEERER